MARVFFALQPEAGERAALHAAASALIGACGGRPVSANNLHVTLCFLGEVAEAQLPALCAAAATVRPVALQLRLHALDYWPRPRLICAIARDDAGARRAAELAQAINEAVSQAGFTPDRKPFRAHLTMARQIPAALAAGRTWPQPLPQPQVLHGDRFLLMRSDQGETGSTYRVVGSWPGDAIA